MAAIQAMHARKWRSAWALPWRWRCCCSLWSMYLAQGTRLAVSGATISVPRVRTLTDRIIQAQREEIAEMKARVKDLEGP